MSVYAFACTCRVRSCTRFEAGDARPWPIPNVASHYRILDRTFLRNDVERTRFSSPVGLRDAFALEIEAFAVRAGRLRPERVALLETLDGRPGLLELTREHALDCGADVLVPGAVECGARTVTDRGVFSFGAGGQLLFRSAACARPADAYEECALALDSFSTRLAAHGIELVTLGADPWRSADEVGLQDTSATARCIDAVYGAAGGEASRASRLSAATRVYIGFGSHVLGPMRFRAARALAALTTASFANSALTEGTGSGHVGVRSAWRRSVDPSRTSFACAALSTSPLDAYLDFALDARVLIVRTAEQWFPQLRSFTFRQWLEHGLDGVHPDLDDWRFHLTTLDPDVSAQGWIVVDAQDAQARPYWSVPLVVWSALLEDRAALSRVLELGDAQPESYATAARVGLCDPVLGERARALFGLVAEALLRRPSGWVSNEMLAAFVSFGERFVFKRRTPGDDVLDMFARRSGFGLAEHRALVRTWSAHAGTQLRTPLSLRRSG